MPRYSDIHNHNQERGDHSGRPSQNSNGDRDGPAQRPPKPQEAITRIRTEELIRAQQPSDPSLEGGPRRGADRTNELRHERGRQRANRNAQYDKLHELYCAIERKRWSDILDDGEWHDLQELAAEIRETIRNGTFHFHDVPCIGPVTGVYDSLLDLWDDAESLGPDVQAFHEREWMQRNGFHHTCARNHAFAINQSSAGLPCPPCEAVDAGCYYERCQYGNRCNRDRCPCLHPVIILMLALAFAKLGIPTAEASDMAEYWAKRHEWNFPRHDYHFDAIQASIVDDTKLPPRGCAKVRQRHGQYSPFAIEQDQEDYVTWHKTALIDLGEHHYDKDPDQHQRDWTPPALGGLDHSVGASHRGPRVWSAPAIKKHNMRVSTTFPSGPSFQMFENAFVVKGPGKTRWRGSGKLKKLATLRQYDGMRHPRN